MFAWFLATVLAGPVVAQTASVARLDEQYGFRDLKFEQSIRSIAGMVLLEDAGDMKFYSRKNDPLEYLGARLQKIEYAFYKGQLANVTITAANKTEAARLLKALQAEYGAGRPSPRYPDKYYWFGEKVLMDFMPSPTGPPSVGMWSKPLQARQQADKQAGSK
jgi:hypothetical protein